MSHNADEVLEHQDGKSQKMQSCQSLWQALIVACQASKTARPAKTAFHNPASRQKNKPLLGFGQFDHFQFEPLCLGCLRRLLSGVALIDKGDFHRLPGDFLHLVGKFLDLCSILFIGRRDMQSQQMPQGVYGDMRFAAPFALVAIIAGPFATLRAGLQRATIEYRRRGLLFAPFSQSQQDSQVMDPRVEHARLDPALGLLVNYLPRRQVVGYHPPGSTRTHNPMQTIEHFSQAMYLLWRILGHQDQIWDDKRPLVIAHITRISFSFHTWRLPSPGQSS